MRQRHAAGVVCGEPGALCAREEQRIAHENARAAFGDGGENRIEFSFGKLRRQPAAPDPERGKRRKRHGGFARKPLQRFCKAQRAKRLVNDENARGLGSQKLLFEVFFIRQKKAVEIERGELSARRLVEPRRNGRRPIGSSSAERQRRRERHAEAAREDLPERQPRT